MKNRLTVDLIVTLLLLCLVQVTLNFAPIVMSEPGSRKEVWKIVRINNPHPLNNIPIDVNVTLNSRTGVYIACSSNVTDYFANESSWQDQGYTDYWSWLDGTSSLAYHWGQMDWFVSMGSLTAISYDSIQQWGDMYWPEGAGKSYTTFMGNTYMADWNFSDPHNDPDIVYQASWQGNQIRMIDDLMINASSTIWIVFKIVLTSAGSFTFDITCTPGVTVAPATWALGGISTAVVPGDYSTIQAAIDSSNAGEVIVIFNETSHSGLFAEDLIVPATKANLEIKPYVGHSVTIKGVQNSLTSEWPLARPNIEIDAIGVKIHGFTIESPDYTSGKYSSGIVIGASNVEIYNNTFRVTPAANQDEVSQALQTWHKNAVPGVDVSGLNIHNNLFVSLSGAAGGYEGIYINLDSGNGTVTVQNNLFKGSICRAITTERSKTVISGNSIVTDLTPNGISPSFAEGWQGINIRPNANYNVTDILVTGNVVNGSASGKGFQYGVALGSSADTSALINISVQNNTIQINQIGIWVRKSAGGITVKWNNIFSNTLIGVSNENTTQILNAAYNWWGHETGPAPGGSGDSISGSVAFEPWLVKPYPPLVPVAVVRVTPQSVLLETPSLGTTFVVNVEIANVTMMYAFSFMLRWDKNLLNVTSTTPKAPTIWGTSYYYQSLANNSLGNYSLRMSATYPAPAFNGTITVVSLTFQSILDPASGSVACGLTLENVKVGDINATDILRSVFNGSYSCTYVKPKLLFKETYSASKVATEFEAYINVTNAVKLGRFSFTVAYDTNVLTVINVSAPSFKGNPIVTVTMDPTTGQIFVDVNGINPPIDGSMILAKVKFNVTTGFVWSTETPTFTSKLNFTSHLFNNGLLDHDAIDGTYVYNPVPGDLNRDGLVDIVDLMIVAGYFGANPGSTPYAEADLNHDGWIDILDIILVARNFGRTTP